ncbi:MAG: ATP-binding cassette domain-containing protein [Ectothiorhodospiraceae bacterium]|nr:ATP-binding cassette domain-containing protein [Ectothiorhodospiraceae bacterium]
MSLEIQQMDVSIDRIPILRQVSLTVPDRAMVGLIGHNGAGKTTLMRTIMGLLRPTSGSMRFHGENLAALPAHRRGRMAISYMPEDRRLIPELTVEENILLPAWANGIRDADSRLQWIYSLMPEIAGFGRRKALQLSGGQQTLVARARALMPGRRLGLLDEPFEGVAPVLARRLAEVMADLRSEGLTVLISESDDTHSADMVDRVYRIERGAVAEGRGVEQAQA